MSKTSTSKTFVQATFKSADEPFKAILADKIEHQTLVKEMTALKGQSNLKNPTIAAARAGAVNVLKTLLNWPANLATTKYSRDLDKLAAEALYHGQLEVLKYLVQETAFNVFDTYLKDSNFKTYLKTLGFADSKASGECLEYLLKQGLNSEVIASAVPSIYRDTILKYYTLPWINLLEGNLTGDQQGNYMIADIIYTGLLKSNIVSIDENAERLRRHYGNIANYVPNIEVISERLLNLCKAKGIPDSIEKLIHDVRNHPLGHVLNEINNMRTHITDLDQEFGAVVDEFFSKASLSTHSAVPLSKAWAQPTTALDEDEDEKVQDIVKVTRYENNSGDTIDRILSEDNLNLFNINFPYAHQMMGKIISPTIIAFHSVKEAWRAALVRFNAQSIYDVRTQFGKFVEHNLIVHAPQPPAITRSIETQTECLPTPKVGAPELCPDCGRSHQ